MGATHLLRALHKRELLVGPLAQLVYQLRTAHDDRPLVEQRDLEHRAMVLFVAQALVSIDKGPRQGWDAPAGILP